MKRLKTSFVMVTAALGISTGLIGCGESGNNGQVTTGDFPVNETFAAALIGMGIPEDISRYFAAAKLSSNCPNDTTCTYLYTYPNGATRLVTLTATRNQQYTPTAAELASTASISDPIYDAKFAAIGIEDSTPSIATQIDISYFVPTTSIPKGPATVAPAVSQTPNEARAAQIRAAGVNDGFKLNLKEVGAKGVDVGIGSILEYYDRLGKTVKATGSAYAIASALSDIAGAMTVSKETKAWLAELDALEKCAADPTNPLTQTDPAYSATTVANLRSTRAEIMQISAVRFINIMGETGAGITPATAVLSIPLKPIYSWTEQTLKEASEKLMRDARSSVVSCKPSCPTNLVATGVSESQINLSWSGSIGRNVVTGYKIFGGGANGISTAATAWTDSGLTRSTTYCYTVSAYNEYGTADNCPQACGTTLGPPVVHGTTPYGGETRVAVNRAVTATFSEAMNATTITTGTFTLSGSGGSVAGTVSYSGTTATFTPSANLKQSTTYTATITTGVKDLDGSAMEANHTWSFTTEGGQPNGNLQFSTSAGGGSVVTSGTANVTWTLFEDLGDVRRFVPSGTITADISIAGCDPMHATFPVQATVPGGPGPTLVVYTASNAAFANRYQFTFSADPNTMLPFLCGVDPNKKVIPMPAPIAFMVGLCESAELQSFTDEAHLAGTYSCLALGLVNTTWNFTR